MNAVSDLETPAVTIRPRHHGRQHPPRAGAPRSARHRQPAAHQDPQDSGAGQAADAGRRGRHHLPEARRSRGVHRCRASPTTCCSRSTSSARPRLDRLMALSKRLKRLAVVLDNEAVAQGLSEAGVQPRRRRAVSRRVRHRHGPQRRADAAGGARPCARRDEAAAACSSRA